MLPEGKSYKNLRFFNVAFLTSIGVKRAGELRFEKFLIQTRRILVVSQIRFHKFEVRKCVSVIPEGILKRCFFIFYFILPLSIEPGIGEKFATNTVQHRKTLSSFPLGFHPRLRKDRLLP